MYEAICDACLETTAAEGRPELGYAIHVHALSAHRPAGGTAVVPFTVMAEDGYRSRVESWGARLGALTVDQTQDLATWDALIARLRRKRHARIDAVPRFVRARPEGVVA